MKYGDEEAHLLLLAVKPSHRALRRRQRAGRLARGLGAGRRRRPHHARGARQQRRRRARSTAASATRRRSCCPATTAAARPACRMVKSSDSHAQERYEDRDAARLVARRGRGSRRAWHRLQGVPSRSSRCHRPPSGCRPAPTSARSGVASSRSRSSVEAHDARAFESYLHAGTVFNAGTADADRGRDTVVKSWLEIVDGRSLALRWRPGIVQIGGEPGVAVSRGPYILQTMKDGAPAYRVGLFQTVWVKRCARRVVAGSLRRQRQYRPERRRPCGRRCLGRGSGDVGLQRRLT